MYLKVYARIYTILYDFNAMQSAWDVRSTVPAVLVICKARKKGDLAVASAFAK